jgi:hypothetical protein
MHNWISSSGYPVDNPVDYPLVYPLDGLSKKYPVGEKGGI